VGDGCKFGKTISVMLEKANFGSLGGTEENWHRKEEKQIIPKKKKGRFW